MPGPLPPAPPASPQPSPERRARPRLPASASLTCQVFVGAQDLRGCGVVDLSGCGVGLSVPRPFKRGALLRVVLTNPVGPCQHTAFALVARCDGPDAGVYRLGAQFVKPLPDAEVQRLTC